MLRQRLLALGPATWVLIFGLWIGPKYDRFVLPAFDGHVYAAMAESPRIFTLPPWGYRILEPWIVHLLPASSAAIGYFWLNLFLLAGTVFTVGVWLRRLGFSSASAALASFVFAISPPLRVLLEYQVLVDPLAVLLLVLVLDELIEPDLVILVALTTAAALTKETGLLVLALVPIALVPRMGLVRGLFDSLAVSAPAVFLSILLRLTWGNPAPPPSPFSVLDLTLGRIISSSWDLLVTATLSGLLLPVLAGLVREPSVPLRIQGAVLWMFTFGLILANPYHYSVSDLPRLSIFAWPALLPLALAGLGFKRTTPSSSPSVQRSRIGTPLAILALSVCLTLVAVTDPYRRAAYPNSPDPVALVGRLRETIKTARALELGEAFVFDALSGRFALPVNERFNLTEARRQRWFLYRGFGRDAAFGSGPPAFRQEAQLLLPLLVPRTVLVSLAFEGPGSTEIRIGIGNRDIASIRPGAEGGRFQIPGALLTRGDNLLWLREASSRPIRLLRFEARVEGAGPRG